MLAKCVLLTAWTWWLGVALGDFWDTREDLAIEPGPQVRATQGAVWPKPHSQTFDDDFFIVRPNIFQFKVKGEVCDILEKALQRYKQDLKGHEKVRRLSKAHYLDEASRRSLVVDDNFRGYLDEFLVELRSPCEKLPHMDMDEHYELHINSEDFPNAGILVSQSIWGILRGLETWSQLIYVSPNKKALIINTTSIMDFPRFSHRGLLIDTSRHFLPLRIIFSMLDAMAMNKLNVLHWHIVDDQSFPFQSQVFPDLSVKGAYAPTHVYTPADVQAVITHATLRGIRVIPEFDTPGHTRSWGEGYPYLLTECYSMGKPGAGFGPMNPIIPGTYDFMQKLLKEVNVTFPDSYIHLGGDEVDFQCWDSNPELREFMDERNWTVKDLEGMYIQKVIDIAKNLSVKSIVWQEVFDDGIRPPNDTLIHIWKKRWLNVIYDVTKAGFQVLFSSCWYLDHLSTGGDWQKFYECDPYHFPGADSQKKLVVGGEACMWGEVVDVNNVLSRVWPRASATAEKLWSPYEASEVEEAAKRLEEHTCRMNRRKIPAQPPNGPGFCPGINFI